MLQPLHDFMRCQHSHTCPRRTLEPCLTIHRSTPLPLGVTTTSYVCMSGRWSLPLGVCHIFSPNFVFFSSFSHSSHQSSPSSSSDGANLCCTSSAWCYTTTEGISAFEAYSLVQITIYIVVWFVGFCLFPLCDTNACTMHVCCVAHAGAHERRTSHRDCCTQW